MADKGATTGDAINHAVDKASEGLAQVAAALSKAAPKAYELASEGVFAQGAASLTVGAILFSCAIFLLIAATIFGKLANWKSEEDARCWMAILSGIAAIVFLFVSLFNIASADSWARVISPDGYLAQQILSKAL